MAAPNESDVGSMIRTRIKSLAEQKAENQIKLVSLNEELRRMFSKVPRKPRESRQQLDEKIEKLEHKRTTTSLPLATEKQILREIAALERTRLQLDEYVAYEQTVEEKKKLISELRSKLKTTQAALDELESALQKVELAKKLGCTAGELRTTKITCPPDKIGKVIGKNGSTIKQIMRDAQVTLDVDGVNGTIEITGSQQALKDAEAAIDKIAQSMEELVKIPENLMQYLASKHIPLLQDLRTAHPGLVIEVLRGKSAILLRGDLEEIADARVYLLELEVVTESKSIAAQESGVIVGKKGTTIDRLSTEHHVTIRIENINDSVALVRVTGPQSSVSEALEDIHELLNSNREVTEYVEVSRIIRNTFLSNSGSPIKTLQRSVNEETRGKGGHVLLSFGNDGPRDNRLSIRGRQSAVNIALPLVEEAIAELQSKLVTIEVDPYVIPRIIGKGGATISELQKNHKGVLIELDKSGKVEIQGSNLEATQALAEAIRAIANENKVKRIDFSAGALKAMFRELIREKGDELNALLSAVDLDEESSQIMLRGAEENLEKAAAVVNDFIELNYMEEVNYGAEDEPVLATGGMNSPLNKMGTETGVTMSIIRSKYVVLIRGTKANVQKAAIRLRRFLLGGDGHTVFKFSVTEQALGVVIGKGGSKRAEIEAAHEGVSLFIHHSNRITIRGPEQQVNECRVEILRLLASARVQEVLPISVEQQSKLMQKNAARNIIRRIPVQVNVTHDSVRVRGVSADVKDAVALLKEYLTGIYEARIDLDSKQLSKIRDACRDPSHFERIAQTSKAEIELDLFTSALVISGKRNNAVTAKSSLMSLLDFLLPSNFAHIEISTPLHSTIGSAPVLADIAARSGGSLTLDRDMNMIHVQSSDPEKLEKALDILNPKIEEANKLVYVVQFRPDESWLIPVVIGKGGNQVNALRMESGCHIDISKEDLTVTVSGESSDAVDKGRECLTAVIDKAQRETAFVDLPAEAVASFIGRSGQRIRQFAETHGVEAERMRKEPTKVKLSGPEDCVAAAKGALAEWIANYEEVNKAITAPIDRSSIRTVLGKEGATISGLQDEFRCKIEIDRDLLTVTVRGGDEEKRQNAMAKIDDMIAQSQAERRARTASEAVEKETPTRVKNQEAAAATFTTTDSRKDRSSEFPSKPVGLTIVDSRLSKSQKRRQRKEAGTVGTKAGRNLFDLLVSDDNPAGISENDVSLLAPDDQWDSSTFSSANVDTDDDTMPSRGNDSTYSGKSYYKSASGFTVRV